MKRIRRRRVRRAIELLLDLALLGAGVALIVLGVLVLTLAGDISTGLVDVLVGAGLVVAGALALRNDLWVWRRS